MRLILIGKVVTQHGEEWTFFAILIVARSEWDSGGHWSKL